jgi:hypothetical protein
MSNFQNLKNEIANTIKANGNNEIDGALLQEKLLEMVDSLGKDYKFRGVATPDGQPITDDTNVFYVANTVGTYPNYGGLSVADGEIAFFTYNGSWRKITLSVLAQELGDREDIGVSQKCVTEKMTELESVIGLDFFVNKATALRTTGKVNASVEGLDTTDFLPITGQTPIQFFGGWTNKASNIIPLAFYDELKHFISYKTGDNGKNLVIPVEEIPANAKYIRCCANTGSDTPVIYGVTLGSVWEQVSGALTQKFFLSNGTNLNDVISSGIYMLSSGGSYENSPLTTAFLMVASVTEYTLQIIFNYNGNKVYKRKGSSNGATWEEWQQISLNTNAMLIKGALPSADLNTIGVNATYILVDSEQYENVPYNNAIGFLRISTTGNFTLQEFFPFSSNKLYKRRGIVNGTWTDWGEISGSGTVNNITNNYEFPSYENTYNIEVSPRITTDTNNFLAATGDSSDRTVDIVAMLQNTGYCKLGVGTFYVSNLEMPDYSTIEGCGAKTRIILADSGNFALKMGKTCGIHNVQIIGNPLGISVTETIGDRHGILWQGNYNANSSNEAQPYRGLVSNVWINGFNGGGITCYNTGYGTTTNMMAVNVNIWNCTVGLNIEYWSEFHKFTNVRAAHCWYGCINNGGNNIFNSCDFSSCLGIAFLMDNSQGQSPNNSHGSAIGCVFNHTASNTGIGIKILDNDNGFIFSGCQIFYSQIYIKDSTGIAVTNTNFGSSNCAITIEGDGCTLLANNIFQTTPTITKNNMTRIVGCYTRNGVLIS